MSRNAEYQFVSTDTETLVAQLIAAYEKITGATVRPASPERLFIQWVSYIMIQERVLNNYTGNQNIPSRAEGKNLVTLGELFYIVQRPDAQPAVCTERFYISEAQATAILIPAGTRVTDASKTLVWETLEDAYIPIGAEYADVRIRCQTPGTIGNDYALGQLNTIVDVFDYYTACENITVSDSGSDRLDDAAFYKMMRASMDGYSTAGPMGGYVYRAKLVSSEIADVVANSPIPGEVRLYVLMNDGTLATEEMKTAALDACNADTARPLTDHVLAEDPDVAPYNIDLTYWINSAQTVGSEEIQSMVAAAVKDYIAWQSAKLGRDINPSVLIQYLMRTGIKRVELRSPVFTPLRDGRLSLGKDYEYAETIPQIAAVGDISIISGGYEDE